MKHHRFELTLGAALAAAFWLFSRWHAQGGGGKLTHEEIERYLAAIEKLPLPQEGIQAVLTRLRPWAEADDGKPVYMYNLIHFFPELHIFPGAPAFQGTPEQANAHYEKGIRRLWLTHAAYPVLMGSVQRRNLLAIQPERTWNRVAVARYPNRRTFLKLLADPAYGPLAPDKFMALEIDLVPVSGDMVVPDLRWLVGGGFGLIFLLAGWLRAAHHNRRN